jgi:hypothetical protein
MARITPMPAASRRRARPPNVSAVTEANRTYVQENQPEGVPPLELTGERTLPDVPEEN